jgi:hypothetical protein
MADTPVDPGAGSLTLTGPAPSLAQPQQINPGVGELTLLGPAPVVGQPTFANPGAGVLTFSSGPPLVEQTHRALPGVGSLTLFGGPPLILRGTNGDPEPGILTLTGPIPSVVQSINGVIFLPITPAMFLVGPRPTVTQTSGAREVLAGVGSLQLLGFPPTITQSANGVVPGTPASYSDLITSEHRDKPRFKAVVELLVSGLTDGMKVLASMPVLYQFNNAQGQQLDRVGEWIGLSRFVKVPSIGTVELSDTDYRLLLISKIAANHYDGSFQQYQQILSSLFVGYGFELVAVDSQAMSIDIYVVGATPTPLQLALMQGGFLPPKPEGVRINSVTVIGDQPVFGVDYDNGFISGPDVGAFY